MTSPGPAPTVTPTPAFGDPGTHHLVCGTNPLLILWFNWREKNPPEPRPRVWGALWAPEPEPGGGGPPNFYGLLQITSWKWPSAAGSPGSLRGAVFHAREKSRTWPCAARPTWPEAPGSRGAVASPGKKGPSSGIGRAPGRSGLPCCSSGPWNLPVVSGMVTVHLGSPESPNLPGGRYCSPTARLPYNLLLVRGLR